MWHKCIQEWFSQWWTSVQEAVIMVITSSLKLGSSTIELSRVATRLGDIFEEQMTWTDQLNATLNKLSKTVRILCKFRYILPQNIKLLIYISLFLSNLSYCYLVWNMTTKTNTEKLHELQKRALWNIVNAAYDSRTEPIFKALNLLPVHEVYDSMLKKRYTFATKNDDVFFSVVWAKSRWACVHPAGTQSVEHSNVKIPVTCATQ